MPNGAYYRQEPRQYFDQSDLNYYKLVLYNLQAQNSNINLYYTIP